MADNWNELLTEYGIEYSPEISNKIRFAAEVIYNMWELKGDKPYFFTYVELKSRYSLPRETTCAQIAAGRMLHLNDEYVVKPELVQEAKSVFAALYRVVMWQAETGRALSSLWLADSRQALLRPYGLTLDEDTRTALADAENALCDAVDYKRIFRDVGQAHPGLSPEGITVVIAAARLGSLDERYVCDSRHYCEAKAVLSALVNHIK